MSTSSTACTISIIGGINRDEVRTLDGRTRKGWGGILYNIAALRRFGPRNLTIRPIAFLGSDARKPVGHWLRKLPRVATSALISLNRRGNLCKLHYTDADHRDERLLHVVPSLKYQHLRPALGSDLILVNFISGRDVSLSALQRLRKEFAGPIYLDIHSYLLGRHRDGTRFSRRPKNWRQVIACADFLQMNEIEFTTLSGMVADPDSIRQWARTTLTLLRCQSLMVTLAARGAFCATRQGRGWRIVHCPSKPRPQGSDPTGAGDVFTGAWIASWLVRDDTISASLDAAQRASHGIVIGAH